MTTKSASTLTNLAIDLALAAREDADAAFRRTMARIVRDAAQADDIDASEKWNLNIDTRQWEKCAEPTDASA